jgi:hypothetical protein
MPQTGRGKADREEGVTALFEFLFAGQGAGHVSQSEDVAAEPKDLRIFSGQSLVLSTKDVAEPGDSLIGIHN